MRTNCENLERRINTLLVDGATKYRSEAAYRRVARLIEKYMKQCQSAFGEYLFLAADRAFTRKPIPQLLVRADRLLQNYSENVRVVVSALQMRASLTLFTDSVEANWDMRRRAADLANEAHLFPEAFLIRCNWVMAAHYRERFDEVAELIQNADVAASKLPPEASSKDARVSEGFVRLHCNKAKMYFGAIITGKSGSFEDSLAAGNACYDKALASAKSVDHRRVNTLVEWAEELIKLHRHRQLAVLSEAATHLEDAKTGLDSHSCNLCRAYFHYVNAYCLYFRSKAIRETGLAEERVLLGNSLKECRTSIREYDALKHPNAKFSEELEELLMAAQHANKRPRKIFLSHKSANKDLVRKYAELLEALGFEPWLDESSMPAGTALHRGMLAGFKDSCAVVFFITPDFKDESYLATEIEYAVEERRLKGSFFSVITLVFRGPDGQTGVVPGLLRGYVWKTPDSDLSALKEIIRALPLAVSVPHWKSELVGSEIETA